MAEEPQSVFPGINAQHAEVMNALSEIRAALHRTDQKVDRLMTKVDDEAAAIAANTAKLNQIGTAITNIDEGHSTISDEIAALKAQIAAGTPPDFTALDNAVTAQTAAIGTLAGMVPTTTT